VSSPIFMFGTLRLIFEGVGFHFYVWHSFSAVPKVLSNLFFSLPRASGLVFIFCAPVFHDTKSVGFHFYILRSQTHFRRYQGHRVPFHILRSRTHFGRYRGTKFHVSYYALPDPFSMVPRVPYSNFLIMRFRTHFRWYRGGWVQF
jgi:hypothetical protein